MTRTDAAQPRNPTLDPGPGFVLPSRAPALDRCRAALPAGPILLTGDAGAGKSWLWNQLRQSSPDPGRWLDVDLTPANTAVDLYRLIGHGLGLGAGPGRVEAGSARVEVADALADASADGRRWTLVVEEAHNLPLDVWEEVRVLANRLGRPGGFAALILVGQTPLARQFSTRPFAAVEARLAARVHLGPIDADEALDLLQHRRAGRPWSVEEAEILHRDSLGNPGKLLRLVGPSTPIEQPPPPARSPATPSLMPPPPEALAEPEPEPEADHDLDPEPLTGPAKPPLRVEENLIEVGWSPDDDDDAGLETTDQGEPAEPAGEEAVHDHYAALQAWREWSENQVRRGQGAVEHAPLAEPDPGPDDEGDELDGPSPLRDHPTLRAEGQQGFAPFGPLFSRLAQARDPE